MIPLFPLKQKIHIGKNRKIMKIKGLLLVSCMALLTAIGCDGTKAEGLEEDKEKEAESQGKSVTLDLLISGYAADTTITVPDFTSLIDTIQNNCLWLDLKILESGNDKCKLKLGCNKNSTANIRTTQITVLFKNKDVLNLNIKQKVVDAMEDIHDHVSDQPALAPKRPN